MPSRTSPVVEMVVPLEDQAHAMFPEQGVEDRPQGQDVGLAGVGADREDRLVEEGDDEPPRGLGLGEILFEPCPLLATRREIVLGVDGDEVDVPLIEGVVACLPETGWVTAARRSLDGRRRDCRGPGSRGPSAASLR